MNHEHQVLACVDQSPFANAVADAAAWAAQRLGAPLELLHAIDRHPEWGSGADHSGAIGINAQAELLQALADDDETRTRALREQGRVFLNGLRGRASLAGAPLVDVRQRHGTLESALAEQTGQVQLLVMGRQGASSAAAAPRSLGRHVERVVRAFNQPILAVPRVFQVPRRVMVAYDGGAVTRRAVELVATSPLFQGLPLGLLMAGPASQAAPKHLAWATQRLGSAGLEVSVWQRPGDAPTAMAEAVRAEGVGLIVMGAYGHSAWRSLMFGSKTADWLRQAEVPSLLLR
ncbi:MAG: universal stress protein [Polaromonas sp.]|nr:universal stress protein [Polaromonas sp.]